tara:strand:+ start:104 stop:1402 length:1299 start_codon:yes stop_codon:yes gene_type:complete
MDEEQPKKKITLNNFFEQIVEIDKVANAALTNSNMVQSQLNAVQLDLKRLVESLQVNFDSGVQNVQTQINEVTNVIVQEQVIKKSETDALEEEIFAQEDRLQKQVKGKKATATDGNLVQQTMSSVKNKAKANLLAAGLFGASALLAGLKPPKPNKVKDKEKDNQEGDKSLGFTGFTEENVGDDAFGFGSPFDTDLGIGDDAFGFGSPFDTDLGIGDDAFGFGSFDTTEIIKNIIDEKNNNEKSGDVSVKQQLILTLEERANEIDDEIKLNKELLLEKDVSSITAERKTIEEAINNLKLDKNDNKFGGNDYLQKLKNTTSIEPILNNISNIGDGGLFDDIVNSREDKINVGDDGFGYGNFDTDIFKINDDTSNNVIDGGTTIIEGNNEVVNEDISSGQGRGEVATDVSIVKSSNSPVSAVAIAEGNSLNHLTI